MKRALLVTSLVCSALVGCGDDGKTTGDTVTPTTPPGGEESTGGNGETVGVSSATEPEQPTTTSVMGTETNDPSNTTPPPAESSGGSFLVEIDGVIDENQCNPFTQDCPEGEKCMPWANDGGGSWNATRCSPISDNPGEPGEASSRSAATSPLHCRTLTISMAVAFSGAAGQARCSRAPAADSLSSLAAGPAKKLHR